MGTLSVDKLVKTSAGAAEFTLPATDGTAGQVWQTDGAGQLSVAALAADTVTATQIAANAVGNSEMADDAVGLAELSATGTASATTFLRGDNAWQTPTDTVGADTSLSNLVAAGSDKIVKAWASFDGDPLGFHDSFNVSSLTDIAVGVWDVTWATDFANAGYAVTAGGSASSGGGDYMQTQNTLMTVSKIRVYAYTSGGGTTWDPNYVSVIAIGDQ